MFIVIDLILILHWTQPSVTLPPVAGPSNEKEKGVFTWLKKWRKGKEARQNEEVETRQVWEGVRQRWQEAKQRKVGERQGHQEEKKMEEEEEKPRWQVNQRELEKERQEEENWRQQVKKMKAEEHRKQEMEQAIKQRKEKALYSLTSTSEPSLPGSHHEPESCGHSHCSLTTSLCCVCSDRRVGNGGFQRYVDGVGYVNDASREEFYCPGCKNFLMTLKKGQN
jgi:hypothetical protein